MRGETREVLLADVQGLVRRMTDRRATPESQTDTTYDG
jgi:hypothetical protein